jgi:branched-chain amino acid transport system ATP-binding protein
MEQAMLELTDVHAAYGKANILNGLSLTVAGGQVVALLGRNGAGKSTTMKTVMGLVPARAGNIRFDGRDITGMATHLIARLGLG